MIKSGFYFPETELYRISLVLNDCLRESWKAWLAWVVPGPECSIGEHGITRVLASLRYHVPSPFSLCSYLRGVGFVYQLLSREFISGVNHSLH